MAPKQKTTTSAAASATFRRKVGEVFITPFTATIMNEPDLGLCTTGLLAPRASKWYQHVEISEDEEL
jgi:hypothetical protein